MFTRINNIFRLCAALLLVPAVMAAQPKDNNPLTRLGIGDLVSGEFVHSASMGGLGAAYNAIHLPNIINPAALGFLESSSLNIGLYAKSSEIEKGDVNTTVWSGNIDYFALSMPVINPINEILERRERNFGWGMNFTLRPYSRIGYNIQSAEEVDSIGTVDYNFQGTGGTYIFSWGNGMRYKDVSFGFTLGYLFGQADYAAFTNFPDIYNDYRNVRIQEQAFSGFVWNTGLQWKVPLEEPGAVGSNERGKYLNLGLYYSGQKNFTSKADRLHYAINDIYNDADTSVYVIDEKSKGQLPSEFGVGVIYEERQHLKLGANFSFSPWSNYENPVRPEDLEDSWRIGVGGAYTPDATSITSYLERIEYRLGFHYMKDPRVLEGEQGFEYSVTAGVGMPFIFPRQFSFVNIALEYGRRGMKTALTENFFRVHLGFSLNDNQWFIKRRYN